MTFALHRIVICENEKQLTPVKLKKKSLSKVKYQCKAGQRSLLFLPGFSISSRTWDTWAQPFSMPYAWLPMPALNCFVRYTHWNSHSVQITIRAGQILRMHPCWWGENLLQNVSFKRQFLLATHQLWALQIQISHCSEVKCFLLNSSPGLLKYSLQR